jgi:hypothetical protein
MGFSVGAVGPKEHPDEENIRTRADTRAATSLDLLGVRFNYTSIILWQVV